MVEATSLIHESRHSSRSYGYVQPVQFSEHFLYLHPREDEFLRLENFALTIDPTAKIHWLRDDCDNTLGSAQIPELANRLEIRTEFLAHTLDATFEKDSELKDYAREMPFQYEQLHHVNLMRYLLPSNSETQLGLRTWLDGHFATRPKGTLDHLAELNRTLHDALEPHRRDEPGIQTALQTISLNSGACRDYATLLIELLRLQGVAARFVSGYFYDPVVAGTPAAAMHAWAEAYLPGAGWKGLDPTTGRFCGDAYVPVAHAAVAESVNPIQGAVFTDSTQSDLKVDIWIGEFAGHSAPVGPLPETEKICAPLPAVLSAS